MALLTKTINNERRRGLYHPWEKLIKNVHRDNFHQAHNSVNNPEYPEKKVEIPNEDRARFKIIGNRVTKEFIYCEKLLKDLHKYRWKVFDAPEIRGVTTVEWPQVWKDIKIKYGELAYCLQSQVAVILNDKFLGGEKELREVIESRYHYRLNVDYYKEGVNNFVDFIRGSGRPCVYMHITINFVHVGTLIFMLYSDLVPYTCENFLRLCQTNKGGYKGTPIHRIVKDGWIQCGGFGLKSTDLDCENFIVPHDRRGVLCMANDGRHKDCSTQFFVLLQPALWMAHKYVAFGQLIDGELTLKKIESVPTFYESPDYCIYIHDAGILNLECHDIRINKNTNEYIDGHIEDLNLLGEMLYENLMERLFLELELRLIAKEEMEGEGESKELKDDGKNIRATERFIRKKEEIEKLRTSQLTTSRASSMVSEAHQVNNDFDVEVYEYEPEESSYQHVSLKTESLVVKPEKPFYIPLTDVPYPDEVDSTYDLKKFLKGDYCLESDLQHHPPKKIIAKHLSFVSEMYQFDIESEVSSVESLSEDDEQEIKRYIKLNVDRVSFAGDVIRNIARGYGKYNIFEGTRKSELITDEELRRFRLASMDHRAREGNEKKVSLSLPAYRKEPMKIKRRQTGFVRMEDIEKIHSKYRIGMDETAEQEEDEFVSRKVRIAESAIATQTGTKPNRRPTGFVRATELTESDTQVRRQSALTRLYDNIAIEDESAITLKDYKPITKVSQKNFLFTASPLNRVKYYEEYSKESHFRPSITVDKSSYEQVLNIQHGRKAARKISSDYVKTIDQIEQRIENSIRSIEFAKTRPSMTVSEYQQRNQKYSNELAKKNESLHGLRLPGDTPLYSMSDVSNPTNI
ncbi:uncharacterized protein LOC116769969 [Danaus plexippus]|uniref:uncharacterized protein LOC116769969 n=1 Tax=Danaus plexippus TaxID=13037 RepID=UPI002AB29046|nr:uncharacterized protein LOC116769969 [Danaus plexippus]